MSPEQLRKILLSHSRWLQSDGQEGDRADLTGADLSGADLTDADLTDAALRGANLTGATLAGANLTDADLPGADLIGANLTGAGLTRANLEGADLTGADLTGAKLTGAKLTGAKLTSANLASADLHIATLTGANLAHANLTRADLSGADLTDADLRHADLPGAILTYAHLVFASLAGAGLNDANLTGANLIDADLTDAYLVRANLTDANLPGANLTDANLTRATLEGANLTDANLTDANLTRANLTGAYLVRADLTDANLAYAVLIDADQTGANLTGANLTGVIRHHQSTPTLAYGRQTRAISKLSKQSLPLRAGAFKRLFPAEFERVKEDTQGRDFTPALLAQLVAKYGMTWKVTESSYGLKTQRLCPSSNDVLLLNVDISDDAYTDQDRKILRSVKETSRRSGHPTASNESLFTVGWVRYCEFPDRLLVEEIQSDVSGVRKGLKDKGFVRSLQAHGLSAEEIDRTVALMQPLADRFYEDALGLVFDKAEASGKAVEMLDYEQKREFGSPKSVYTDLPRKMGMKLGPSVAMPDVGTVWGYVPNRWRSR